MFFETDFLETSVYGRADLKPGHKLAGPAIIEEDESTLVVPPGFNVVVDAALNLLVNFGGSR